MQPGRNKKSSATGKSSGGGSKAAATPGQKGASTSSKNSKESFQKKILICQRVYDYYDESKDVKGKTERLNAINEI